MFGLAQKHCFSSSWKMGGLTPVSWKRHVAPDVLTDVLIVDGKKKRSG